MSNLRPESRIKSLEKRATDIEAAIEELSSDQAEELRAIRQDISQLGARMDKSFDQAHAYIDHHMTELKATMATKQDISTIDARLGKIEATQEQILKLLQQLRPSAEIHAK